ncbi:MAG: bifunctional 5,10-methylenetetrahydrofolate dehydrogenase/5,10-methenyltetrahydrofolate cyclohydrolase [Planctomycetes bacterium]|nr:bifunctional 5,10-methylenetetrahydrofolate dehydrogenase/5,10-methenyltetrahydrofolate cyclohydrolase [Planctomycetota bacterium]
MTATMLDGRALAGELTRAVADDVKRLARRGRTPHLVSILAQEDAAAEQYVRRQRQKCRELGIKYTLFHMSDDTSEEELAAHVDMLNANPTVTGIIVQLPTPEAINATRVQGRILPSKDVEGMAPANLGNLLAGQRGLAPCTALAVMELIRLSGVALRGREVTVIGHSRIVGQPLALLMLQEDATVTSCHIHTQDLAAHTRRADVVVSAVGRPAILKGDMLRPGAVVIDVGISEVVVEGKRHTVGDVEFDSARHVAGFISPVPGGVGPVTVAMLLRNTVKAAMGE